jgi:hypothetical protein
MAEERGFSGGEPAPAEEAMNGQRIISGAGLLLLLLGCGVQVPQESKLVFKYSEGIWNLNQPIYRDHYLACHPDAAPQDVSERVRRYEEVRKTGHVTFSSDGVEVIKLGALGNGAFFKVHDSVKAGPSMTFRSILKPEYVNINFNEFPPNAILYIMGRPLGTIIRLRPGKTPGPKRDVVESVDLKWTWIRLPEGSAAEWCLQSIEPDPASAKYTSIELKEEPLEGPAASPDQGPATP